MKKEIWKDFTSHEGYYQVSNLGNVKSYDTWINNKHGTKTLRKGRVLKQYKDDKGYKCVSICVNARRKVWKVHQIVAITFLNHAPCGHKIVVDHIDNNRNNNRVENLQLISSRLNTSKDRKGGTSKYTGVCFNKRDNKWTARIKIEGVNLFLGNFKNEYEAHLAYQYKINQVVVLGVEDVVTIKD